MGWIGGVADASGAERLHCITDVKNMKPSAEQTSEAQPLPSSILFGSLGVGP